jgi:hypothetical protein
MSLDKLLSKLSPEKIQALRDSAEHANLTLAEMLPTLRQNRSDLANGVPVVLEKRNVQLALPAAFWELLEVVNSSFTATADLVSAEVSESETKGTTPLSANLAFREVLSDTDALASQFLFDDLYTLAAESVHRFFTSKIQAALVAEDFDKLQAAIDDLRRVDPTLPEVNIQQILGEIEAEDESILPN